MDEMLLKALHKIKAICGVNRVCNKCPFGSDKEGGCFIHDKSPVHWNLKEEVETPKYFVEEGN